MIVKEPNPTKPEGEGWVLEKNYYREGISCKCGHDYWAKFRPNVCYYCGESLIGLRSVAVLVNYWVRKKSWFAFKEYEITEGPNKEL